LIEEFGSITPQQGLVYEQISKIKQARFERS
jgi:hypothetical protein